MGYRVVMCIPLQPSGSYCKRSDSSDSEILNSECVYCISVSSASEGNKARLWTGRMWCVYCHDQSLRQFLQQTNVSVIVAVT